MAIDKYRTLAIFAVFFVISLGTLGCGLLTSATKEANNSASTLPAAENSVTTSAPAAVTETATQAAKATQENAAALPSPTLTSLATEDVVLVQSSTKRALGTVAMPTPVLSEATTIPTTNTAPITETVIGYSYENRPMVARQFGAGSEAIVLVGGIHGGYEWNSVLLAYEAVDYFAENPDAIPEGKVLYIVPSANPDGLFAVAGKEGRFTPEELADDTVPGRFNGRGVDLNRNWDCQWKETGFWRDQPVSAGTAPFSEPESAALRDFLISLQPSAVIFYHSAADGVYAAGCPEVYPPARELADIYGAAAGYTVFNRFDYYAITGDAGDWLAIQNIPSITVELATHEDVDWEKNLPGILEVLNNHSRASPAANVPTPQPP